MLYNAPMPGTLNGPVPAGTTIGRWTVIAEAPRRYGIRCLLCRCACGTERSVLIGALRTGASKSCGCLSSDTARRHGMSTTPEHVLWRAINQRCHNPKHSSYRNYGARGIHVCDKWRRSFEAFFADVGRRPSPELTLDRRDNDGHYEPDNVRWATRSEQMLNTRLTHEERSRRSRINAMNRWHPAHDR